MNKQKLGNYRWKSKAQPRVKKPSRKAQDYANQFELILQMHGVTNFQREWKFLLKRRFRFDFAFINAKVAVEVHGNKFHGRYNRLDGDSEKNNLAILSGWVILVVTTEQMKNSDYLSDFIKALKKLLRERNTPNVTTTDRNSRFLQIINFTNLGTLLCLKSSE
jgi:very-short-patch-repair endonuclease